MYTIKKLRNNKDTEDVIWFSHFWKIDKEAKSMTKEAKSMTSSTAAGLEPARAKPKGFRILPINHSSTLPVASHEYFKISVVCQVD